MRTMATWVFAALLMAAGCASNPPAERSASTPGTVSAEEAIEVVDKMVEETGEAVVTVDDTEVICRREHVVGTRFPQKVCKTRAQMELDRQRSQEALQRHNDARNMTLMKQGSGG